MCSLLVLLLLRPPLSFVLLPILQFPTASSPAASLLQISQVLTSYVTDYFGKELTHVQFRYGRDLQQVVDDPALLTKVRYRM